MVARWLAALLIGLTSGIASAQVEEVVVTAVGLSIVNPEKYRSELLARIAEENSRLTRAMGQQCRVRWPGSSSEWSGSERTWRSSRSTSRTRSRSRTAPTSRSRCRGTPAAFGPQSSGYFVRISSHDLRQT